MKYLFFLLLTMVSLTSFAQRSGEIKTSANQKFDNTHINWSFSTGRMSEGKYFIEASALIEAGWHVFSENPGGDGSLTHTQIEVIEILKNKTPITIIENEGWIEKDMEGIGSVRFFENRATFRVEFSAPANIKTFTGNISYQTCNDVMCMAPTSKPFNVSIKK